jgi:NAD(P)-dependent dehydrogenase (short-subunit alcohol dehydrogenase family)
VSRLAVLGAAGGIGRALCAEAERRGWKVAALDLPASLERHGMNGTPVDATDRAALSEALFALAPLAGFVMLAGFMSESLPFPEVPDADWDEVIAGNLTATRNACAAAASAMDDGGAMVLTGSGLGHFARPGYGAYAVAKAGVSAIARQMALDCAPRIRVNAVAPSAVDTAFLRGGTGRSEEDAAPRLDMDAYAAAVPLGRIALPGDVTGPILFLLSEDARYVTGQTLHVNGGTFMP